MQDREAVQQQRYQNKLADTSVADRLALAKGKMRRASVLTHTSFVCCLSAAARNWCVAAPLGGEVVKRCFALGEARHAPPGTVVPVA